METTLAAAADPSWWWFLTLTVSALVLGETPLKRPFRWMETYYHELSHGLACLLTGGKVVRIQLNLDGSGVCTTRGGSRILILLAGYTGAALWGSALYLAGWHIGAGGSHTWLQAELALLAVTTILWVRNLTTLLIIATIAAVYGLALYYGPVGYLPYLLQFSGVYVLMNAIRAPLHLIDGQHVGDGAALADIFKILPEGVWILLWFAFALACLAACALLTLPGLAEWLSLSHIF
ncbi:MAG: M50 family metallopeptidase [Pseudomonadaceae bacterium]|nr:M50 family metallopeptidase [Pseudomonadaceae bacterium]